MTDPPERRTSDWRRLLSLKAPTRDPAAATKKNEARQVDTSSDAPATIYATRVNRSTTTVGEVQSIWTVSSRVSTINSNGVPSSATSLTEPSPSSSTCALVVGSQQQLPGHPVLELEKGVLAFPSMNMKPVDKVACAHIKERLRDVIQNTFRPKPGLDPYYCLESMMLKRAASPPKPAIILTCCNKPNQKRLQSIILSQKWLASYQYHYLVRVGQKAAPVSDGIDERVVAEADVFADLGGNAPTLCGIVAQTTVASEGKPATFTIGGTVMVDGVVYALTVAHPFTPRLAIWGKGTQDMVEGVDDDDDSEEDDDDISPFVTFDGIDEDDTTKEALEPLREDLADIATFASVNNRQSAAITARTDTDDQTQNWKSRVLLGASQKLLMSHHQALDSRRAAVVPDPDWALIKLDNRSHWKANLVSIQNMRFPAEIQSSIKLDDNEASEVWINAGVSSPQRGWLTEGLVYLDYGDFLFHARRIILERPLAPGDSGSWVIRDSQVCGHIVSADATTLSAYMVSFDDIIGDISKKTKGTDIRLPSSAQITAAISNAIPATSVLSSTVSTMRESGHEDMANELQTAQAETIPRVVMVDETATTKLDLDSHELLQGLLRQRNPRVGALTSTYTRRRGDFDVLDDSHHDLKPVMERLYPNLGAPRSSLSQCSADDRDRFSSTDDDSGVSGVSALRPNFEILQDRWDRNMIQGLLPSRFFGDSELALHIKFYQFQNGGGVILGSLLRNREKIRVMTGDTDYRNIISDVKENKHSSYMISTVSLKNNTNQAVTEYYDRCAPFWQDLKCLNPAGKAVGRIVSLDDPSPLSMAMVHFAMHQQFDVDEIFEHVAPPQLSNGLTKALMNRAFEADARRQRSFIFVFKYYNIVGEGLDPAPWHQHDRGSPNRKHTDRVNIAECSAVLALSLEGEPTLQLDRIGQGRRRGAVFDTFAPWHLLSIRNFADAESLSKTETRSFLSSDLPNGPFVFLDHLTVEYENAVTRFSNLKEAISKLATPDSSFIFDSTIRDKLLFEDRYFTYVRRYFWAYNTLGILNQSIDSMVSAYFHTFDDTFWAGEHPTLWSHPDPTSAAGHRYRIELKPKRAALERSVLLLDRIRTSNVNLRSEIEALRTQLASGLAARESLEASDQTKIIKVFTVITAIFLPLSFVAAAFSMNIEPWDASPLQWVSTSFTVSLVVLAITVAILFRHDFSSLRLKMGKISAKQSLDWLKSIKERDTGRGRDRSKKDTHREIHV